MNVKCYIFTDVNIPVNRIQTEICIKIRTLISPTYMYIYNGDDEARYNSALDRI